jgi:2-polyprenyl-3-methyl-5-hydroxy-6-metoxy-1,4-benzoquinol methylase
MENKHSNCLICKKSNPVDLTDFTKAGLTKCSGCGFVFAKQIPTEKELIEYYNGYGRNDYLSPITIKRYNELLDKFEKFRKTNKILDVGCGIGYFLEVAKKRGWEVYGTEYTDEALTICNSKGITMKEGKLIDKMFDDNNFDIITSFEVLEHINNPLEEIGLFHKFLRTGGLVYLTTPNFNSLLRYKLKEKYNVITYPEHLSYYTPRTLNNLFNTCGFKKLNIQTTGISLTRLKTSSGKTSQAYISESSDDEKLRNNIESKKYMQLLKDTINFTLTLFGIGDSLKGWFIKK